MLLNDRTAQGREKPAQKWFNSILHQKHRESTETAHHSFNPGGHDGVKMVDSNGHLTQTPKGESLLLNASNSAHSPLQSTKTTSGSYEPQHQRMETAGSNAQDSVGTGEDDLEQVIRERLGLNQQDTFTSETLPSFNSLNQILDDRKGDPEVILQNLGFSRDSMGIRCRIPDRFLQASANTDGISLERFLEANPKVRDYLEEKSVIQNPFEMLVTAPQARLAKRRMGFFGASSLYQVAVSMTMVNRFKKFREKKGCLPGIHPRVPLAEPVSWVTENGCRYWSILPEENRTCLERSGYYDALWSNSGPTRVQGHALSLTDDPRGLVKWETSGAASNSRDVSNRGKEYRKISDLSDEGSRDQILTRFRYMTLAIPTNQMVFDQRMDSDSIEISELSASNSESTIEEESVDSELLECNPNSSQDYANFGKTFVPMIGKSNSNDKACTVENDSIICDTEQSTTPVHTECPASLLMQSCACEHMEQYSVEAVARDKRRTFYPMRLKDLPSWFSSTESDFDVKNSDISAAGLPPSECKYLRVPKKPELTKTEALTGPCVNPNPSLDLTENDSEKKTAVNSCNSFQPRFREKLKKDFSTMSDSSGFADVDQLDIAEFSINEVFEMPLKSMTVSACITKERMSCIKCSHHNTSSSGQSFDLTNLGDTGKYRLQNEKDNPQFHFVPKSNSQAFINSDTNASGRNRKDIRSGIICDRHFPDLSDHRILCDQLQASSSFQFQALHFPLILKPTGLSAEADVMTVSDWIEFFQEEVKLVECALLEYKLMSRRMSLRMSKVVTRCRFDDNQAASFCDDHSKETLLGSECLQEAIMQAIETMEEFIVMRTKYIINLRKDQFDDCSLIRDLASISVIQMMSRLLREQAYQSSIVTGLYLATARSRSLDQWPDSQHSYQPTTPSSCPLLHSPVPMFASSEDLMQLNESMASLTRLLHGMQLNTENITNESKTSKRKRNYQRILPACFRSRWMKK